MLTEDALRKALPPNLKNQATTELVDKLNALANDPIVAEEIKANFLSYTTILKQGKFKVSDYLNAVVYVSHKIMGATSQEAYIKTFPKRYQELMANKQLDDLAKYVAGYSKSKLVNLIIEQTLIPSWVLNQSIYQKAINVQAELMSEAKSEMVRMQAANSLMVHLAKPKEVAPLINLDMRENTGMTELKDLLANLAQKQVELIKQGTSTKVIAEQPLAQRITQ